MYAEASTIQSKGSKSRLREVIAAAIGSLFEWYDLGIYATFAVTLSAQFFPASDKNVSLLLGLLTYASAYVIRPLGAVIIGNYADKAGRRPALVLSAGLMAAGTLVTGILPNYQTIGLAAPILLVVARLIQGFSAGGEFGSANSYLTEQNAQRRAFYGSLQFSTVGIAILMSSAFAYVLHNGMSNESFDLWGWRIPFLFGLLIAPVAYYLRKNIDESPEFSNVPNESPLRHTLQEDKYRLVVGALIVAGGTVASYVNIYMPTYAMTHLHLPPSAAFAGGIAGGLVSTIFPPAAGALADRLGAVRIMRVAMIVGIALTYPMFLLLSRHPSVVTLALIQATMSFVFFSFYYSPVGSVLTQLYPASRRTIGVSISYVASQTFFGGITPVIINWMISETGNPMVPGLYLSAIGVVSLFALTAGERLGAR
jgi:MHS family proline/betaine transporter-like MFS transporter